MAVRRRKIQGGVYRSFKIGSQIASIDRFYSGLINPGFDLEKIDQDFDVGPLSEYEKKDYWSTVNRKKRYERGKRLLLRQIKSFIDEYKVSPVLSFDGNEVTTGFEGRVRGFRVKGHKKFYLSNPEWFQSLELPKPPKRLTEVFK